MHFLLVVCKKFGGSIRDILPDPELLFSGSKARFCYASNTEMIMTYHMSVLA
jgi:hypothetical protein